MLIVVTIFEDSLEVGEAIVAKDWEEAYSLASVLMTHIKGNVEPTAAEMEEIEECNYFLWTGGEPGKAVAVQIIGTE